MSNAQPKRQIGMDQFLTVSVNMLHAFFFKEHKDKAKRLYKEIADGDTVNVATITLGDEKEQQVKLRLTLDQSEFRGHLTFHLFQKALQHMLQNIAEHLNQKKDLNIFTSEETDEILVHIPGLVQDDEQLNVIVMGLKPGKKSATIKLQFLDPEQFKKPMPTE